MNRDAVLITPVQLRGLLDSGRDVVLLDVRWELGRTDGQHAYLDGHLPGAVFVDLETELAGPPSPEEGRHPLPALEDLEDHARRWGVRSESAVVVYDAVGGLSAARAWWLLRWGGHADVRILDGGLAGWLAVGGGLVTDVPDPVRGDVELVGHQMPVVDADGAAAVAAGDGILLDARAAERFRGEVEPVDPRAGHVPGAVSAPTSGALVDGAFLPDDLLRPHFEGLGVDVASHQPGVPGPDQEVAVYCGSGVTASHEIAALAAVGVTAALYPGSWSQWSNDSSREVATGA